LVCLCFFFLNMLIFSNARKVPRYNNMNKNNNKRFLEKKRRKEQANVASEKRREKN